MRAEVYIDAVPQVFTHNRNTISNLPNASFTAFSTFGSGYEPFRARFSNTGTSYAAGTNNNSQWLAVDFGEELWVDSIATRGRANAAQWWTSYKISYSTLANPNPANPADWNWYGGTDLSSATVFTGNTDQNTPVWHNVTDFKARHLRYHVVTWQGHVSTRIEAVTYRKEMVVGKGYQHAEVNFTAPTSSIDNLLAYFNEYTTLPNPLNQSCNEVYYRCQPLNHGFWTIQAYNSSNTHISGDGQYSITLRSRKFNNICGPYYAVMKRSNIGDPWNLPAGACWNSSDPNVVLRGGLTGFSDFAVTQTDSINPLFANIIKLDAKALNNKIQVSWTVSAERGNIGFEVERSTDGISFEKIGFVASLGNINSLRHYSFDDKTAKVGVLYYYRLQQVNEGGNHYTPTVTARLNGNTTVQLYPNPVMDEAFVEIQQTNPAPVQLRIYTVTGVEIWKNNYNELLNERRIRLDVKDLPAALYIVEVKTENKSFNFKMNKQ
jgi:hypothetical protein